MKGSQFEAEHIKSLEWAVLFSRMNLNGLRAGDWLNLKEDLYRFIDQLFLAPDTPQHSFLPPGRRDEFVKLISQEQVSKIQERIKSDLFEYSYKPDGPTGSPVIDAKAVEFNFVSFGPDIPFNQWMQALDVVVASRLALGFHLVGARITQANIRICPECRSLFLIKRRPRKDRAFHCSLRCSRNAATQRYREKKKGELRLTEKQRSRRRYVERQQRKYGPKVKVGRKPRKLKT